MGITVIHLSGYEMFTSCCIGTKSDDYSECQQTLKEETTFLTIETIKKCSKKGMSGFSIPIHHLMLRNCVTK